MKVEITRDEFEAATQPLLERTRHTTDMVLRDAGFNWKDIDRVLLVGGSTRMPMVARMLEELTGKQVDRSLSPDTAVAHGAALYADLLLNRSRNEGESGGNERFSLTNVNSHSLGIVGIDNLTKRKINHILIPKNTPLPFTVTESFKTAKRNQRSVKVEVLEGENPQPDHCTLVGTSVVRELPPDLPAGHLIEVCYSYKENGQLDVTARVKGSDAKIIAMFSRDTELPESDLNAWGEYVAQQSGRFGK